MLCLETRRPGSRGRRPLSARPRGPFHVARNAHVRAAVARPALASPAARGRASARPAGAAHPRARGAHGGGVGPPPPDGRRGVGVVAPRTRRRAPLAQGSHRGAGVRTGGLARGACSGRVRRGRPGSGDPLPAKRVGGRLRGLAPRPRPRALRAARAAAGGGAAAPGRPSGGGTALRCAARVGGCAQGGRLLPPRPRCGAGRLRPRPPRRLGRRRRRPPVRRPARPADGRPHPSPLLCPPLRPPPPPPRRPRPLRPRGRRRAARQERTTRAEPAGRAAHVKERARRWGRMCVYTVVGASPHHRRADRQRRM
mmetsp:Transcript_21589/g.68967  ORF Transcript_21589/g.68967 Transcript_21589/m.68967 type:complete len:311 (-) Transcript_21589:159-1091(-)